MSACPICAERITEWLWGELAPGEQRDYEAHLAATPACAREARALAAAERASRRRVAEEPSPALLAGLKAEARKAVAEHRAELGAAERRRRRAGDAPSGSGASGWPGAAGGRQPFSRSVALPAWLPVAASLTAVAVVGWFTYRSLVSPSATTQVAQAPAARNETQTSAPMPARERSAADPSAIEPEKKEKAQAAPDAAPAERSLSKLADEVVDKRDAPAAREELRRGEAPVSTGEARDRERGKDTVDRVDAAAAAPAPAAKVAPPTLRGGARAAAEPPAVAQLDADQATSAPADIGSAGAVEGASAAGVVSEMSAPDTTSTPPLATSLADVLRALEQGHPAEVAATYDRWLGSAATPPAAAPAPGTGRMTASAGREAGSGAASAEFGRLVAAAEGLLGAAEAERRDAARTLLARLATAPDPAAAARARRALSAQPAKR